MTGRAEVTAQRFRCVKIGDKYLKGLLWYLRQTDCEVKVP